MLALTFANPDDYNRIREDDSIDVIGLEAFMPDTLLQLILHHADGSVEDIMAKHTYNEAQIDWFKAGSCLNFIKDNQ